MNLATNCIFTFFTGTNANALFNGEDKDFGYIVDFILGEEKLHVKPKIGDIVYADPYTGELVPFQIENELLYFKVVKLDEINVIIK